MQHATCVSWRLFGLLYLVIFFTVASNKIDDDNDGLGGVKVKTCDKADMKAQVWRITRQSQEHGSRRLEVNTMADYQRNQQTGRLGVTNL